jgi:hypothetical protein
VANIPAFGEELIAEPEFIKAGGAKLPSEFPFGTAGSHAFPVPAVAQS